MKFKLLLPMLSIAGTLVANDIETDKVMWQEAYNGNFSLVHKMALARECKDLNDELLSELAILYACRNAGMHEEAELIYEIVETCIEYELFIKKK